MPMRVGRPSYYRKYVSMPELADHLQLSSALHSKVDHVSNSVAPLPTGCRLPDRLFS